MMLKPLPPLKTLPVFIAVANYLSFSQAARVLCVTHSAISQSIKSLESYLGHLLFNRDAGKVSLTVEGKRYYSEIYSALAMIQQATQQQLKKHTERPITINIINTLAVQWLIPQLSYFQAIHPNIDIRIATLGREVDFSKDDIDLAIQYGKADNWPNSHVTKLLDDTLVLVTSPKLLDEKPSITKIIKEQRYIEVNADLRKNDWKNWCDALKIPLPASKKDFICFQSSLQALQAVVSALGVMVTHKPFLSDYIRHHQLVIVPGSEIPSDNNYYIVMPNYALEDHDLKTFYQWLIAQRGKK